uniref:DUF3850 domain-containing protein n=1 Tax=viral metagenome TaxID=1070528 RepID=A0A6C0KQN1_9ZZZZ
MSTSKYLPESILNLLISNVLTCIAKLNVGYWNNVKTGDTIAFTDGKREVSVRVDSISFFNNFGDAWFTHGDKLIPASLANIVTVGDAIRYYRHQYTHEDTIACGVVVFLFHIEGDVKSL